jgi:hypothetical protein
MLDRRELLCRGLALGLAPALLPLAGRAEASPVEPPQVRRRVRLGKTGLELPDIGFGASSLAGDEALVGHALARGISYFDTAESYRGGSSEETIGRALAGRRSEVLLASKQSAGARTKRSELFETLEGSLHRPPCKASKASGIGERSCVFGRSDNYTFRKLGTERGDKAPDRDSNPRPSAWESERNLRSDAGDARNAETRREGRHGAAPKTSRRLQTSPTVTRRANAC